LDAIWDEESVKRIRDEASGADLDILDVGSRRDSIRFDGAEG
jgi:hypothetical protein